MTKVWAVALSGLLLSACTDLNAQQFNARMDALDARLEPEVDATIDQVVRRLCRLPVDVMNRQLDTPDKALGASLMCSELNDLVEKINEARLRLPE